MCMTLETVSHSFQGLRLSGNTDIPYGIMKKYDDRCKKIAEDEDLSFEEARKRTNVILDSFILSIKNNRGPVSTLTSEKTKGLHSCGSFFYACIHGNPSFLS